MSDGPDKESKTEDATEKRLAEARERGNVPVSREAAVFASLAAGALTFRFLAPQGAPHLTLQLATLIDTSSQRRLQAGGDILALFAALLVPIGLFLLPVLALHMVFGAGSYALQSPPSLKPQRIAPQWSRVSPAGNWSRIFGFAGHLELLKSAVKLAGFGLIAALYLRDGREQLVEAVFADTATLPRRMTDLVSGLAEAMALAAGVLMAVDLVFARLRWRRDQRMSREEVKREMKEADGDPVMRSRLRSLALARSRRRMMASVPQATMVIANPTHYAIALRYVRGETAAPQVLAKGQDLIAQAIRHIAVEHAIPVIEDKALARSMYHQIDVDRMIPPEFYKAVAEIINLLSTRAGRAPARTA